MAYQELQFIEVQHPIFERGMPNFGVDEPSMHRAAAFQEVG